MKQSIEVYFKKIKNEMGRVEVTDRSGKSVGFERGMEEAVRLILRHSSSGGKLYFIGNGASAAIASHQAMDFWKRGGVAATCFNDAALLTCIANDCGYPHVFEKPIEMFVTGADLLVAISSSGKSVNILNGVAAARRKGAGVLTLSGFKRANPLRKKGDLNLYVPAESYGHVEVIHHALCHCLLDTIVIAPRKKR
ncbi:MAG: SIS domain-containing protein [Candidatus Omnitrophica bacterium]|nr:SIS domain-containing protein [Candidatus Omnitrophota bacterium]